MHEHGWILGALLLGVATAATAAEHYKNASNKVGWLHRLTQAAK